MKYYSDKSNENAVTIMFMFFQILMTLVVYGFIYTSFIAVKIVVEKYSLSLVNYSPEIISLVVYFIVLTRTRKMFNSVKKLRAIAWLTGWASLIIVSLYFHLTQLISQ